MVGGLGGTASSRTWSCNGLEILVETSQAKQGFLSKPRETRKMLAKP